MTPPKRIPDAIVICRQCLGKARWPACARCLGKGVLKVPHRSKVKA